VLVLTGLALLTRLVWALWVHPADEFVFRDMRGYVVHASALVEDGFAPHRSMVFQAWGTYFLLALPVGVFGSETLVPAAILWAVLAAGVVPLGYLLAREVSEHQGVAIATGIVLSCWYPSLSHAGLFLSEGPFSCALVAAVWRLVVLLKTGRGALGCGLLGAACLALRPESLLLFAAAFVLWFWRRAHHPRVGWREVGAVALPMLVVLAFSQWYFHRHTGRWGGVAESSRANLTPARCHHPWVRAYPDAASFERGGTGGRVYGVTSMFEMLQEIDPESPLALRPAFGTEPARHTIPMGDGTFPIRVSGDGLTLEFAGHRADPDIHAAIQAACVERTGWREQGRYALVNLSGLWFFNAQWPDNARQGEPYRPWSDAFVVLFQWLVLVPSLLGIRAGLGAARERPELTLAVLPLCVSMLVAVIWFGSIRLRTPYDPFALLVAVEVWARVLGWARDRTAERS
jgi:hypothetical protein